MRRVKLIISARQSQYKRNYVLVFVQVPADVIYRGNVKKSSESCSFVWI